MALTNDPRYDLLLVDSPDGVTANETLPLMVAENAGTLSYAEQMVSPYAGQLASGDLQDRDLTRGTIRTQRDWRGGRGLLNAYAETNRFYDATADTRFTNSVILPPESKVGITTGDPDFLPTSSGVSPTPVRLTGEFVKAGRVDGTKAVTAGWLKGNRSDALDYMRFVSIQRNTSTYHTFGGEITFNGPVETMNKTRIAQAFTTVGAVSVTQLQLYLAYIPLEYSSPAPPSPASTTVRVRIYSDTSGSPGAQVATGTIVMVKPYTATMFVPYNPGWKTCTLTTSLSAATKYWISVETETVSPQQDRVAWYSDPVTTYTDPCLISTTSTNAWGPWGGLATGHYFKINTSGGPEYLTDKREDRRVAQSFTTVGSFSLTSVKLPLQLTNSAATGTTTVRLCANSGGAPGTVLATTTVTPTTTLSWITASLSTSLSAATTYWIEVVGSGTVDATEFEVAWQKDANAGYGSGSAAAKQDSAAYAAITGDFYFYTNTLSGGTPEYYSFQTLSKQALAMKFTTVGAVSVTSVTLRIGLLATTDWQGSPTLTFTLRSDSGGNPGSVLQTVALSNPGLLDWETISVTQSLSAATSYWLMLEANTPTAADGISVVWQGDTALGYGNKGKTYNYSSYSNANIDFYFTINGYGPGNIYWYNWKRNKNGLFQKFTVGASGVTATFVRIFAQMISGGGQGNISVQLWTDSAGSPGAIIGASTYASFKRPEFDANNAITQKNWIKGTLFSSASLSASTSYWLFIGADAPFVGDSMVCDVYVDANASYAGGTALTRTNTDEWSTWSTGPTQTYDVFFTINIGSSLGASVTANPQRFGSDWYAAAGTVIYKYTAGSNTWTSVYTAAANVTRLASYGGKLYAALGDSTDMVSSSNGTVWAAVTGSWKSLTNPGNFRYTFLKAYNGFLYCLKWLGAGGAHALAYTNGTDWYSVSVASSEVTPRGLAGFMNEIMITATTGLYSLSGDLVYQVSDWELEHANDTGRNPTTWVADGQMYIPIRSGLNAFNGSRMTPVGLDLDEGLPAGEQGQVVAMAGAKSFLFAVVDAVNDRSGVYAYNGAGWHCIAKATAVGQRIRAIGLESVTSSAGNIRLWWFQEGVPYYAEMPALTDNPRDYTAMRYGLTGYVTSCAMGGELAQIPKDLQRVVVTTEKCNTAQTVSIYVDVDQANLWTLIGTVTQSPEQTLEVYPADIDPLKVGSGSTSQVIQCDADTLTDELKVGMFVRIGDTDIGQVASIDSDRQFTLVAPLRNGVPVQGAMIYGATPSGYEFRYRLVLNTTDPTKSPLVRRVSLKWQELLIDKGRFSVAVRAEDRMKDRNGGEYPYTAKELRAKLRNWSRRLTPSYLVEPDGSVRRVKITSYNVSGFGRATDERTKSQQYRTRIDLTLDEA